MKPYYLLLVIAVYLYSAFNPSPILDWALSIMCLSIVLLVFASVKRFVQGLGIVFLGTGAALLVVHDMPWSSFITGFGNMLNILSLFALIPIIALPIVLGNYASRIQHMIHCHIKHSGLLYTITSSLSYVLSSFMNVAALPLMYHTIRPALDVYPIAEKERFMSRAITHGYSMPIIWTPVAPIVGIIVEMTGVSWSSILPVVIPFSLLGLVLDGWMGRWNANRRHKKLGQAILDEASAAREHAVASKQANPQKASHPVHIIFAILVFNILIFLLETYTSFSFLLLVTAAVIPFAFVWAGLLGKARTFAVKAVKVLPENLLKMKEQFFIFLSAGFMISAIQTTGAGHVINAGIIHLKEIVGAELFLLVIPLIPFALAFAGLHPAVGLALAAESLNPFILGISPELMAIAMLIGATTAFMMGPYNATAGMMASLVGKTPFRVSNWNAPFAGAYLFMGLLLLLFLEKAG